MRLLSIVALLCVSTAAGLWGQSASVAQIVGTVQDSTGSAIADAQVKVTQTDTGLVRTVATGPDGSYVLPSLPIGPYRMEVSKSGFSTYVQSGIVLQVNTNPTIDVSLKVGSVTEQVVVEAAAAMVETRSTGVGQVVDSQRMVDIPLNGRNATDLIYLAGAAAQAPTGRSHLHQELSRRSCAQHRGRHGQWHALHARRRHAQRSVQQFESAAAVPRRSPGVQDGDQRAACAVRRAFRPAPSTPSLKSGTNSFMAMFSSSCATTQSMPANSSRRSAIAQAQPVRRHVWRPDQEGQAILFSGIPGHMIRQTPSGNSVSSPRRRCWPATLRPFASPRLSERPDHQRSEGALRQQSMNTSLLSPAALKMWRIYPRPRMPAATTSHRKRSPRNRQRRGMPESITSSVPSRRCSALLLTTRNGVSYALMTAKNPLTTTLSGADDLVNSGVFGDSTW